jgi:hypothetical protein
MTTRSGTVWRHKKTGGLYTIMSECRLERTNEPMFIYLAHYDGTLWARAKDEFLDGRFEEITPKEQRTSHMRDHTPPACTCSPQDVHDYGPCGESCGSLVGSYSAVGDET